MHAKQINTWTIIGNQVTKHNVRKTFKISLQLDLYNVVVQNVGLHR